MRLASFRTPRTEIPVRSYRTLNIEALKVTSPRSAVTRRTCDPAYCIYAIGVTLVIRHSRLRDCATQDPGGRTVHTPPGARSCVLWSIRIRTASAGRGRRHLARLRIDVDVIEHKTRKVRTRCKDGAVRREHLRFLIKGHAVLPLSLTHFHKHRQAVYIQYQS